MMPARARAAKKETSGDAPKDSIVISWKELQAIKDSAVLGRSKDKINKETLLSKQKEERLARAQSRKEKMIEMESNNKKVNRLTEGEKEKIQQDRRALSKAQTVMDEDLDDVKHMNQIMLYAKVATIRDAQIAEKKERLARERAEEIAADQERERQRIELMRTERERQQKRRQESRKSAAEITEQINERKQKRLREQEMQAQEAQAMLETVRLVEQKQEEERIARLAKGRKRLEEVMLANNAQAREKLRRKQEELEEELKIAEYLRQKELREQADEAEKERLKAIKDKEIARMRGIQERAIDNRAQLDELRARRYQEEKDREWRQKELAAAEKKRELIRSMQAARQFQKSEKARLLRDMYITPCGDGKKERLQAVADVDSVDCFQGRDMPCIVLSMVRHNDSQTVGKLLHDWRRINVAVTRAKTKLVLIGSTNTLRMSDIMKRLVDFCDAQQWVVQLPCDALIGPQPSMPSPSALHE